ncbi:MAG: MBL fold metallo-hydrolase [Verrucomicrobiae bacterium]|nr:MBL fold metallo-hydrolase [Verrucomicrobiae bacterium]
MAKLEDLFGDIVNKARRGHKLTEADLGQKIGLTEHQIKEIITSTSKPDDATLRKLAGVLGLGPDRLVAIANDRYSPATVDLARWGCAVKITSPFEDYFVHTYMIWDKKTKEAVLFDTGTQAEPIHDVIRKNGLTVKMLCLTHTHPDHIVVLDEIRKKYNPPMIASKAEPVDGAKFVREGDILKCGGVTLKVLETEGHSPGGFTFVASGLGSGVPELAVVGDAIFAGSMGGPMVSYERLHANVKTKILKLADSTVLMPGHGPLTTVGEEKRNNPFFP